MIKILFILLLIPCFLKAQTSTDTIIADTVTRIYIKASGNINFDTIKISNNSIEGFTYDLKGFSPLQQSYGHLIIYVTNVNGVYSLRSLPANTGYTSVGMGNTFEIIQSGNFIIVRFRAATANKNVMEWTLTKTKIGL